MWRLLCPIQEVSMVRLDIPLFLVHIVRRILMNKSLRYEDLAAAEYEDKLIHQVYLRRAEQMKELADKLK